MTELICIVCPKGCHLRIDEENDCSVTGQGCPRGEEYGRIELTNPTRVLTSTVRVEGAAHRRCPVKTSVAISKSLIFNAMKLLESVTLQAPVCAGQAVVKNICGTGADFIATRDLERRDVNESIHIGG